MNIYFRVIGYLASFILSILLIPQIYTIYKTKDVESISFTFLILQLFANILWIIYGIGLFLSSGIDAIPVSIANFSLFVSSVILIYLKRKYAK